MPTIVALPVSLPVAVPVGVVSQAVPIAAPQVTAAIVAPGPQGPPGAAFSGFGYVRYGELSTQPDLVLSPGVRTQVLMSVDPTQTISTLSGPFANFAFWNGDSLLHARQANDVFDVRLAMTATPSVAGGHVNAECMIVGGTSPVDTAQALLSDQAGTVQRLVFRFNLFARSAFVTSGAQFWLTSSVPVAARNETLLVIPLSAGS